MSDADLEQVNPGPLSHIPSSPPKTRSSTLPRAATTTSLVQADPLKQIRKARLAQLQQQQQQGGISGLGGLGGGGAGQSTNEDEQR